MTKPYSDAAAALAGLLPTRQVAGTGVGTMVAMGGQAAGRMTTPAAGSWM